MSSGNETRCNERPLLGRDGAILPRITKKEAHEANGRLGTSIQDIVGERRVMTGGEGVATSVAFPWLGIVHSNRASRRNIGRVRATERKR